MLRRRGFVQSESWYIHVNVGDTFQIIIFDLINIWRDGEILALSFLRVITLFWMCYDDNMFDFSFWFSIICCRLSPFFHNFDQIVLMTPSVHLLTNQSWFCVVCRNMFLSKVEVLLLLVYFFDPILLKHLQFVG